MRKLRKFTALDGQRRRLLIEAALWLLLMRLVLAFVSFPWLAHRLGLMVTPTDRRVREGRTIGLPEQVQAARDVGWAVTCAARHVPHRALCLSQAMAGRLMLRRRGVPSVMHFGAARGTDRALAAHAWLDAAGIEITGYPVRQAFTEIACFV